MAEETEVEEKKSGGGKGILIVLIVLIVVLLLAVGGLAYFLMNSGALNNEPPQAGAPVVQEQQAPSKEDVGETYKGTIDSLVLNITDAKGRAKLMKLSFTLKTTEPKIEGIIEENKAEIVDAVIRQVSARSSEELLTVGGKAMLKEEMIDEINNILNDTIMEGDDDRMRNSIIDLFFTAFVIK